MQGIAQISAGASLPAMILVACALLVGCAESVPVSTTALPDAAAAPTGTSGATPGGSGDSPGPSGTAPVSTPPSGSLTLAGTPSATVVAGTPYAFEPTVTAGATGVTFAVVNPPAWAVFSTATGELYGTPPLTSIGTTAGITITASNAVGTATLGPFPITVTAPAAPPPNPGGTATLTWAAPTTNTDGTPLTDLAGYHIYYGTNAAQLPLEAVLDGPASTTYVVNGLRLGTYYFTVSAFNAEGTESAESNRVSKTF